MAKAIFKYTGAKNKIVNKILQFIPEHTSYAEVFGGSAAVLLNKFPANDIYNDLNSDVVNIFRILRDEKKSKKLKFLLENTPVSREEFYNFRERIKTETDDLQRAYMYFYLLNFCFGGRTDSFTFAISKYSSKKENTDVKKYFNTLEFFKFYTERFKKVIIENLHFEKFFELYSISWDYKDSFVYLDPPYLNCSPKSGKLYSQTMSLEDHEKLVELVLENKNKAKFLISGYDNDLYRDTFEKEGFKKYSFIKNIDIKRKIKSSQEKATEEKATECLWLNYDIFNNLF